jgi:hypothetical protein
MSIINYTCSLGTICHSSNLLKRNNLKLRSYPFDWIYSSSSNILHCIEDDFKIFLDKSYYINEIPDKCKHIYYYSNLYMFNHHDPLNNIGHYNYFVRCVDRFRTLLKTKEHKLFIMMFTNLNEIGDKMNEVINFNNKFSQYTTNYTLLAIFHFPNKHVNHHTFTYNDNIHFLELYTIQISGGVIFDFNENDNIYLDNIIKSNYIFDLK